MIDIWFKKDLSRIHEKHPVAVFVDESGEAEFLLKTLENDSTIFHTSNELGELEAKYKIEKVLQQNSMLDQKFVIYTQLAKSKLTFIREYCETNGCVEIRYLQKYISDNVHETLNININLPKEDLIAAAKVSVGKDRTYWMDLSHKGASEIFDLKKELLPFVHDPKAYETEKYDQEIRTTFYRKVNDLLGQEYMDKPAKTLADEVVKALLDGLATSSSNGTLMEVYCNWLDSMSYRDSFAAYLAKYTLDANVDIWRVDPNHPFREVDNNWLKQIGSKLANKKLEQGEKSQLIAKLKQRHKSKQAQALGIIFWKDITTLFEFEPNNIAYLNTFSECVDYYKDHFSLLDTAIRNLYTEFLQQDDVLDPFQELYKGYVALFLDKWFMYFDQYREDQTGILQDLIDSNSGKIAIIVGDGVAYEIAEQVAIKVDNLGSDSKLTRKHILADWPSVTENNMSHIYISDGTVEPIQSKREKYLTAKNSDTSIDYIRLDEVNDEALTGRVLICTYKDIDDMGDKLNSKALKYFPESIDFFGEKINQLLKIGYAKVYLITDHGFVLTGLLTEADKIVSKPTGDTSIYERYMWTVDKQDNNFAEKFVEKAKSYKNFNYLYFAKSMSPFKTPSTYGFAHGGLAPQELVTPYFCWSKDSDEGLNLEVSIANKSELFSVTGELYRIALKANASEVDLFTQERKVMLLFSANKSMINKSDVIAIQSNSEIGKEYTFDGHNEIEVQLIDAVTKQQLDRVVVKKNNDRDLGGLF